jgi:hypothetical protein
MERAAVISAGLVLAFFCAAAGAWGASVDATTGVPPAQGPVIAGDRLAYVPTVVPGATSVSIRTARARHAHEIARLRALTSPPDGASFTERSLSLHIAASPSALVATATTVFFAGEGLPGGRPTQYVEQTWAGSTRGPLAALSPPCSRTNTGFAVGLLLPGADGTRVASLGAACTPKTVFDLATRTQQALPEAAGFSIIPGPGGRVAWTQPPGAGEPPSAFAVVVVADASGAELARLPVGGEPRLTLDASGTLAVFGSLDPSRLQTRIVQVLAPGSTSPRTVRAPAGAQLRGARAASGRLALLVVPKGRDALTGGQVMTTNLDGTNPRTILRGVYAYDQDHFDFNGHDVAAMVSNCDRIELVRGPASANNLSLRRRASACPLQLARRPQWSPTGLRVSLSPRGSGLTSVARATARLGGPHGRLLGRTTSAESPFTIRIRDHSLLRRLATGGPTRVSIAAQLIDGPTRNRTIILP